MRRLLTLLFVAAITSPVLAQVDANASPASPMPVLSAPSSSAAPRLTLAQAVATALDASPALRSTRLESEAADAAIQQAGVLPNPVIAFEQEGTRRDSRTTTVQLTMPVELGGKRSARVRLAERTRDVVASDLADRRAEIRASVTQAFFDALLAQERLTVAQESLDIAQAGLQATARRVIAGKVSPTEETRSRVAEATVRIEREQARAELAVANRVLASAMNAPISFVGNLDSSATTLPTAPDQNAIDQRLRNSPALQRAQREVERLGAAYDLERTKRVQDLTVSIGTQRQEQGRSQAVLGLSIPLPLFDRNQGGQLEALRRQDAAQAQAEATAIRLRTAAYTAVDQLAARRTEVLALQQEVLPGARSAFDTTRRGYELGKFSYLDVLDAQRTWLQSRLQYLRALADTHRAATELERLLEQAPVALPAVASGAQ